MLKTMRRAVLAAALALVAEASLGEEAGVLDLVRLRNGRTLEGDVIEEEKEYIILRFEGGTLRIERADIFTIEKDRPVADWELEMRRRARLEADELAKATLAQLEGDEGEEAGFEEEETAPVEDVDSGRTKAEETNRLKRLIEDMASDDVDTRDVARQLVEREGMKAVPLLAQALSHQSTFVRTSAARILGGLRARAAVRDMLVALRSSVPDRGRARPWQRGFVKALRDGLRRITGQSFGLRPRGANQGKAVAQWIEWWDGSPSTDDPEAPPRGAYADWDTRQVGEEKLDEKDPDYARKLAKARRVGTRQYSYRRPADFGVAPGEEEEEGEEE
jgi:hypothetical protein